MAKLNYDAFDKIIQLMFEKYFKLQEQKANALDIIANELMEINQNLKNLYQVIYQRGD